MNELTVHITIKIPNNIEPSELQAALQEAIEEMFVMDNFEGSELIDLEL